MFFQRFKRIYLFSSFFLIILLSGIGLAYFIISEKKGILVKQVQASEIYPEFLCGCCGKPLDPANICCGQMKEMIDYLDNEVKKGKTKDEIIIETVKKFGFDSLVKEEKKKEIKEKLVAFAPKNAPKIHFSKESLDLGLVSQKKNEVFAYLDFENIGQSDLIINNLLTSCGCTSASIVYKGQEGPKFAMPGHGKDNPQNWSLSLAPREKAKLKIYFDPNAHGEQKEASLAITRTVDLISNDPVNFSKRIKIELTQTP